MDYIKEQIDKIEVDGYKLAEHDGRYYKVHVKFWDYKNNSTNTLSISNKEFNQIKKILLKKSS